MSPPSPPHADPELELAPPRLSKEELIQSMDRVDREITMVEQQICKLKRKQVPRPGRGRPCQRRGRAARAGVLYACRLRVRCHPELSVVMEACSVRRVRVGSPQLCGTADPSKRASCGCRAERDVSFIRMKRNVPWNSHRATAPVRTGPWVRGRAFPRALQVPTSLCPSSSQPWGVGSASLCLSFLTRHEEGNAA